MSGIGGIFNLDGTPVDQGKTEHLAEALKQRGPDGIRTWENGPLVLVHSHFWTTPEEVGEEQPLTVGNFTLVADARIDNRDDLIPLLNAYLSKEIPSDAEIILAAYQKWGEEAPRHLIGDFAFAIWDEEGQKLFCARDPVGVRLLQYAQIGTSFVFGSSVGAVIAALDNLPDINLPFIADLIAGRWDRWVQETGYQEIFRLPPAYFLAVHSGGMVMQRYWTFGADQRYHFDTDEEYIACFRELFQEAVRARMRAVGPVALSVSGGLDSSSIACVVNDLIERKEIEPGARMYSHVYDRTPRADERDYFEAVVSVCPYLPFTLIPSDDIWGLQEFGDENDFPLHEPEYQDLRNHFLTLARQVRNDGCRVCLFGDGGDQILMSEVYYFIFYLGDLPLRHLISELPYFSPLRKPHQILLPNQRILCYANTVPRIFKKVIVYLENHASKKSLPNYLASWIRDLYLPPDFLPPSYLKSRNALGIYDNITCGFNSALQVASEGYGAYTETELRYPFFDRRLIEFMVALPPHICFRKGHSRYILRQSMREILPKYIRLRKSKATIQELSERGLQGKEKDKIKAFISDSRLVRWNLVDEECILEAWKSYWSGVCFSSHHLILSLCAEAWFRHQEKIREKYQGKE